MTAVGCQIGQDNAGDAIGQTDPYRNTKATHKSSAERQMLVTGNCCYCYDMMWQPLWSIHGLLVVLNTSTCVSRISVSQSSRYVHSLNCVMYRVFDQSLTCLVYVLRKCYACSGAID